MTLVAIKVITTDATRLRRLDLLKAILDFNCPSHARRLLNTFQGKTPRT
jgi:hypothetical protein